MRIAVASAGPALDDNVSAEFSSSKYLLIVDFDALTYEAMISPVIVDEDPAAGRALAHQLLQEGVAKVLAGRLNYNVLKSFLEDLQDSGIQIVDGWSGTVRGAMKRFKEICLADTVVLPSEDVIGRESAA